MSDSGTDDALANLLIVDDKPANLRLLASMLVEQGYKVRSAINGPLALTATRAAPPDMILLDINMPEMTGYEVCERLKADDDTRDIPIIFISALDETQDKVRAFRVGGVDYITKPFQVEEVLARVETHLALRRLQKELQEANTRYEEELALAAGIQASFLPGEPAEIPGWQLATTLMPARETSGDFYDIIPLPDGRLGLVVADVTDKGAAAALYMALSRTLLRTFAVEADQRPDRAFRAVHRRILADTDTNQFVTVFFGVLDPGAGTLTYANAGHNPPYLFEYPPGAGAPGETQELANTGPPLGLRLFKDVDWEHREISLSPGDVLVLYSDGITEAQDAQGDFFEEERLLDVVQASLGDGGRGSPSAQEVADAVVSSVSEFMGDAPQSDDITLMVLVRQAR